MAAVSDKMHVMFDWVGKSVAATGRYVKTVHVITPSGWYLTVDVPKDPTSPATLPWKMAKFPGEEFDAIELPVKDASGLKIVASVFEKNIGGAESQKTVVAQYALPKELKLKPGALCRLSIQATDPEFQKFSADLSAESIQLTEAVIESKKSTQDS
jgi:hypothetical protein